MSLVNKLQAALVTPLHDTAEDRWYVALAIGCDGFDPIFALSGDDAADLSRELARIGHEVDMRNMPFVEPAVA